LLPFRSYTMCSGTKGAKSGSPEHLRHFGRQPGVPPAPLPLSVGTHLPRPGQLRGSVPKAGQTRSGNFPWGIRIPLLEWIFCHDKPENRSSRQFPLSMPKARHKPREPCLYLSSKPQSTAYECLSAAKHLPIKCLSDLRADR
jgi:hypothetical protein